MQTSRLRFHRAALGAALLGLCAWRAPAASADIPHLEKRGHATQLIVDGQPFLVLGGELRGTASSSLKYMDEVWPMMNRLNLNTVLLALGWDWIEPKEGQFDFSLVDGLIAGARRHHEHIVLLWFGTWKNGLSSFAPAWVKADEQRFPRVRLREGQIVEIVTPFSKSAEDADTRAYVKLLEHLKATDTEHTVLMIQIENEVGVHGDSRDHGAAANAAFANDVPGELTRYLRAHQSETSAPLAQRWRERGAKRTGSWTAVFGEGPSTDELFMAWYYARYVEHLAAAGKAVYPLPMFVNTWLAQPGFPTPGDYPSGGPQSFLLDVWKAGAPTLDMECPDAYAANFDDITASYHRPDNPLFVPESQGETHGVANAFYAIGAQAAIGFSPFGLDDTAWLVSTSPDKGAAGTQDLEHTALAQAYAVLGELAPMILAHQASGTIDAAWLNQSKTSQSITLGDYTLNFELRRSTRDQKFLADLGYGLVMAQGPNEFLIAGSDVQVTFSPRTPGPPIAGIAEAEIGEVVAGRFVPGRQRNGDDILLDYKLADVARRQQSGSGLRFLPGAPSIQHVTLYRY